MKLLLGITGPAGVGKDTVGQILNARFGMMRHAFADPIREGLGAMLEIDHTRFGREVKELPISWLGVSPRRLMQTLGTEWGRQLVHPDLWVMLAERKLEAIMDHENHPGAVFTDVRFRNEAEMITRLGGLVIRVDRPGAPPVHDHVSELGFDSGLIHYSLVNDGTLRDLERQVINLVASLRPDMRPRGALDTFLTEV